MKDQSDPTDDAEETSEDCPGGGRWGDQPVDIVITESANDRAKPANKFEWRPEDIVILEPGDPGYDDEDE